MRSKLVAMGVEGNRKSGADQDPNWLAYKAMEAELKANHMGEWVGFYDGQLVAIDADQEKMLKAAIEKTGHTGILMHQIVEKEEVHYIRSPRRLMLRFPRR